MVHRLPLHSDAATETLCAYAMPRATVTGSFTVAEYTILILGLVSPHLGEDHAGEYVTEYVPASMDERGRYRDDGFVKTTFDKALARKFPDHISAWEFWMQANGRRPDGKPNRPMTAYTVEISGE